MMDAGPLVSLSPLDEERFGIRTAKTSVIGFSDIPAVMDFSERNRAVLAIARCRTEDMSAVQEMERLGFLLMDTLIYFSRDLKQAGLPRDASGTVVRQVLPGEEHAVREVAAESFRGYLGHYHADSRLDRDRCDEVYSDWAYRSCLSAGTGQGVLVAECGGRVAGFGTMRVNSEVEGEGLLFGVMPSCRGRGIYRSIMTGCLGWCVERGLERMIISTQVTNLASQKTWVRLGFEPVHSFYTFHKWFTSP